MLHLLPVSLNSFHFLAIPEVAHSQKLIANFIANGESQEQKIFHG